MPTKSIEKPYRSIKKIKLTFENLSSEQDYLPSFVFLKLLANSGIKIQKKQISVRNIKKLKLNSVSIELKTRREIFQFCYNFFLLLLPQKEYFKGVSVLNIINSNSFVIKLSNINIFSDVEEEMNKFFKTKNFKIEFKLNTNDLNTLFQLLTLLQIPIINDSTRKLY